jgi:magnesium and cobalt transporter
MEDMLEEIVGEIRDEHDLEEPQLVRLPGGEFLVDARMNLEDFAEELEMTLPATEVDTVGGFVIELFDRIPRSGESVEYAHRRFEATAVEKSRLLKIRVSPRPGAAPAEGG